MIVTDCELGSDKRLPRAEIVADCEIGILTAMSNNWVTVGCDSTSHASVVAPPSREVALLTIRVGLVEVARGGMFFWVGSMLPSL